jgi:hypothetical protein
MQNLSNGKRRDEAEFQEKRRQSRRMIRMVIELVKVMSDVGCKPAWEWPLRACSWQLPEMDKLYKLLPYSARVDGCCYGMRTIDTKELVLKSWRIQCATQEQLLRIACKCQGNHTHAPIEGFNRTNATSYYPVAMAKRWMKGLMQPPDMTESK